MAALAAFFVFAVAALAAPARADARPSDPPAGERPAAAARDRVEAAMRALASARSYRLRIDHPAGAAAGEPTQVAFAAPDRYRVDSGGRAIAYAIGDAYYQVDDAGAATVVALSPDKLAGFGDPGHLLALDPRRRVEDLGEDAVDGLRATRYLIHRGDHDEGDATLWIGAAGRPVKLALRHAGRDVVLRYSDFDDAAIRIDPPG